MPALELEERMARLEGRIDEHSKFFESISVKLTLLEDKGDRNRETLEEKIDRNREILEEKIDRNREELERKIETVRIEGNRNREELERKIEKNREEITAVRREMATNFRWIVGIQLTTWITVLLAILLKG